MQHKETALVPPCRSMAHILIANPESIVAELIAQLLRRSGYTFDVATTHAAAVRMVGCTNYDAILAGSVTRIEHGSSELVDELLLHHRALGSRLIVLTTQDGDPLLREKVETLGVYAMVSMPFDVDVLLELLASCCARRAPKSRWVSRTPMRIRAPQMPSASPRTKGRSTAVEPRAH